MTSYEGKINGLDLFSGIGGISLALAPWVHPIAYCESDRFAQSVLLSRMRERQLPLSPIWDDITTLLPSMLPRHATDIIYGGFPCQDISVAGHGKGLEGERSGLFYEIIRLTKEIGPSFVFLENVPAIRTRGLREVIRAFTDIRYDCRWTCVSAADVGAPHLRKRWFLLAHSERERRRSYPLSKQAGRDETQLFCDSVADPNGQRLEEIGEPIRFETRDNSSRCSGQTMDNALRGRQRPSKTKICTGRDGSFNSGWWASEPDVGRVAHGVPQRVDRIKCLGNSVVPAQARKAFEKLMGVA